MVEGFYRCGICDVDFNSSEEWDAHAQTLEHKMKVVRFRMMMIDAKIKGDHINVREFVKKIQSEE